MLQIILKSTTKIFLVLIIWAIIITKYPIVVAMAAPIAPQNGINKLLKTMLVNAPINGATHNSFVFLDAVNIDPIKIDCALKTFANNKIGVICQAIKKSFANNIFAKSFVTKIKQELPINKNALYILNVFL